MNEGMIKMYDRARSNPNNLSYWYPHIKDCGIYVPKTAIIPVPIEWFDWLGCDDYKDEKIKEFNDWLTERAKNVWYNLGFGNVMDNDVFMKTGQFSDKFSFVNCHVGKGLEDIGKKALNIWYDGMCVGCPDSAEIVIREYINPVDETETMYNSMPIRPEFRVFYDFKNKRTNGKTLTVCNYWDYDTVSAHLYDEADKKAFDNMRAKINDFYESNKQNVADMVNHEFEVNNVNMPDCGTSGIWSVDIMYDELNDRYVLIDMAIAETSYYREKLAGVDEVNPVIIGDHDEH